MNWLKSFWQNIGGAPDDAPKTLNNYTPRALQVQAFARSEAARLNHNFIGTEHLLLGLIHLNQCTAAIVLTGMGLDLESLRTEVQKQVGLGPDPAPSGIIPYTPRVKRVFALAAQEAILLEDSRIGTGHLLLGLLREGNGVAARVLKHFDVDAEVIRKELMKKLDPSSPAPPPQSPPSPKDKSNVIDITKRYDVYCSERDSSVVIYRNALIKGTKKLFSKGEYDSFAEFLELEQADGQTVFLSRFSVFMFCEHGVNPAPEVVPRKPS